MLFLVGGQRLRFLRSRGHRMHLNMDANAGQRDMRIRNPRHRVRDFGAADHSRRPATTGVRASVLGGIATVSKVRR